MKKIYLLFFITILWGSYVFALPNIEVFNAWTYPSNKPQQPVAVYLRIFNKSNNPIRLISADTKIAGFSEFHVHSLAPNGKETIKRIGYITVPPKGAISLQPNVKEHIELLNVNRALTANYYFPLTLTFQVGNKREEVSTIVHVSKTPLY